MSEQKDLFVNKMNSLADSINAKAKTTGKKNLDELKTLVDGFSGGATITTSNYTGSMIPHNAGCTAYFNTDLSILEVLNILSKLTYVELRPGVKTYVLYADGNDLTLQTGKFILIQNLDNYFTIEAYSDSYYYTIWNSIDGWIEEKYVSGLNRFNARFYENYENGSKNKILVLDLINPNIIEMASTQLGLPLENDKLTSVISSSFFEVDTKQVLLEGDYKDITIEMKGPGVINLKDFIEEYKMIPLKIIISN